MSEDLKIIKKLYGEAMMHFCRDSFSTILENKGQLPEILQNNFSPSHELYEDLEMDNLLNNFKNYIYDLFSKKDEEKEKLDVPAPEELMRQAGYILYKCETESAIQSFKKYYTKREELCTFNGGRLKFCHVFFAIKENVDEIKRADFKNPKRQDEYGTSVISIQFSKDKSHTLSIKNRYNHTVVNPDATFSNNLDNIIEGLTESFEIYYGLKQEHKNEKFEIPGYTRANDGKWYKYNYELGNIYYCPNNIIIDNGEVKRFDKEKYIVIDYLIIDLVQKTIDLYDETLPEFFPYKIGITEKINIVKNKEKKEITIINTKGEETVIIINKNNQIIGLKSGAIKQIGYDFLKYNETIEILDLPNLEQIGDDFLYHNRNLTILELPKLKQIGDRFLDSNNSLASLKLPSLQKVGDYFLDRNYWLSSVDLPNLRQVGRYFLNCNVYLTILSLPSLEQAGDYFLQNNTILASALLPKLKKVGDHFLLYNKELETLILPALQQVGDYFLANNNYLKHLEMPSLQKISDYFLFFNDSLKTLSLSNLKQVGICFMYHNESLESLELPALQQVGKEFLFYNKRASVGLLRFMQARLRYEYSNILNGLNNQTAEKGQGRK